MVLGRIKKGIGDRLDNLRTSRAQWKQMKADAKIKAAELKEQEAKQKAKFKQAQRDMKTQAKLDAQEMKMKAKEDAQQAKLQQKYMNKVEFHKNFRSNLLKFFLIILVFGGVGAGLYFAAPGLQDHYIFRKIMGGTAGTSVGLQDATSSLAAPLNILKQVFSGTYDPESLWKSEEVKSDYVVQDDAGVVVRDIEPARGSFFTGKDNDKLEVIGEVTIVSLFQGKEETTPFWIGVDVDQCDQNLAEKFGEKISGKVVNDKWCKEPWECTVSNEERYDYCACTCKGIDDCTRVEYGGRENGACETENRGTYLCAGHDVTNCEDDVNKNGCQYIGGHNAFTITRAYNKFFSCTHSGVTSKKKSATLTANVEWGYWTEAVAGKQVFIVSNWVMDNYDPKRHFKIDSDTLKSWAITDGTIDLGIGFEGDREFLRPTTKKAEEKGDLETHELGVSIRNDKSGEVGPIEYLVLTFPYEDRIHVEEGRYFTKMGEPFFYEFDGEKTTLQLQKYQLKQKWLDVEKIAPGEHHAYYIKFWVEDDYLAGSSLQSFFVRAELKYAYVNDKDTVIDFRVDPFEEADKRVKH